jgi:hypothetical protein
MYTLLEHQRASTEFFRAQKCGFDASDPGTGKTLVQIHDFKQRRKNGGGCALIFGTKSILDAAWGNDLAKFAPELTYVVAYAENRAEAFAQKVDVYITNIDAAVWVAKQKPAFFKRFDTLIVDESTTIKHPTAQRSKAMAKITTYFQWRRLLSGTPNPNGVMDLWHQYFLLDDGKRLGKSYYGFRAATCTPEIIKVGKPKTEPSWAEEHGLDTSVVSGKSVTVWTDKPGIETLVGSLVRDITIRHKFEDCVDIPENFVRHVDFALSKSHLNTYLELETFSIAEVASGTITAVNAAVLYAKLLQAASGAVYQEDGRCALINSERYQLVMDLVQERQHSVVFFLWQHQKEHLIEEAIKRKLKWVLIDGTVTKKGERARIVDAYQAGKYDVIFAHPQSTAHGITLTRGTATIWASPTNNLEWWKQGLKRIHRIGQTQKTETIMVIAKGTIDEKVWDALQGKNVKLKNLLYELE